MTVAAQDFGIADPGLQPERTVMAWGRTLLSIAVIGASFLHWLPQFGEPMVGLAILAGLVSLTIYATQRARYRRLTRAVRAEAGRADVVAVLSTTAAVVALGALGIVGVVLA